MNVLSLFSTAKTRKKSALPKFPKTPKAGASVETLMKNAQRVAAVAEKRAAIAKQKGEKKAILEAIAGMKKGEITTKPRRKS